MIHLIKFLLQLMRSFIFSLYLVDSQALTDAPKPRATRRLILAMPFTVSILPSVFAVHQQ